MNGQSPQRRKITCRWPNGTSLAGYIEETADGGSNLTFGPDRQWAIMYIVPEGDEHFPPGLFQGFDEAVITYEEPEGFGAVVVTQRKSGPPSARWARVSAPGDPGVWMNEFGESSRWDDLDHDSMSIESIGVS